MVRTLFDERMTPTANHEEGFLPQQARYTWLGGVRALTVGDKHLLVNPQIGGWVQLEGDEHALLGPDFGPPSGRVAELLYSAGLCARDGRPKQFSRSSDYTEQLYFFEFATTTGCNLACRYCFMDAQPQMLGKTASPDLAELFIDRVAEHRATTRSRARFIIEFTGGEPLLNFPIIRHTVTYAERTYGDLLAADFIIQSNLMALTDEMVDFACQHRVSIGVSCDGFRAVHDHHRPAIGGNGSHRRVEANMRKLRERLPENSGGLIAVITEDSAPFMPEIALYFHLGGYNYVFLKPLARLGRGGGGSCQPFARAYVNGLMEVLTSVITPLYHEKGVIFHENHLSNTIQHLLEPYRGFMCERSPCGAARNICIVMPDGDVYPCNQSTNDGMLCLGNIKDASFLELLNAAPATMLHSRRTEAVEECRSCEFAAWCGSPCPQEAYTYRGSFFAASAQCDIFRHRYLAVLDSLLNDRLDLSVISQLAGWKEPVIWRQVMYRRKENQNDNQAPCFDRRHLVGTESAP